jgi:rhamnogalacturonan endolyase
MKTLQSLRRTAARLLAAGTLAAFAHSALAAFSLTTVYDNNNTARPQYQIDTDAGLVFKVRAWDNGVSTQSAGDISSLIYNGVQYADQTKGTQVNSGFDFLYTNVSAVSVQADMISATGAATPASTAANGVVTGGEYIRVTVSVTSSLGGIFKHYYLARRGQPNVYMGTYFTEEPSTLGLARFIARVPVGVLPYGGDAGTPGGLTPDGYFPNDLRGTDKTVESSDVFGFSSAVTDGRAGQTRSKHYSNQRLKDWKFIGGRNGPTAAASTVGLWIWRDNHEGDSGGPFFRSLLDQITTTNNELTYIVNYGEAQTELFRLGVLNTYTMGFNDGSTPTAAPDTSFFPLMGMVGYVPASGRGGVACAGVSGRVAGIAYTAVLSNSQAQYWADLDPTDGHFALDGMLPGTYNLVIHKGELGVQTASVTVTAGGTAALDPIAITGDPSATPAIWRIGDWDGRPLEFLNGDRVNWMHPSDVRMSNWVTPTFVVGSSTAATGFPAYQWKGVNSPVVIQFMLTRRQQLAAPNGLTVRVGTTADYSRARPQVIVNNWTSAIPPAPSQPTTQTRNLTVGSYRGFNRFYTFAVPASELVVGTNTLSINAVSGNTGTGFLSPGYAFDAVDLVVTP